MDKQTELSFNIISTIKKVAIVLKNSKLDPDKLKEAAPETKLLSDYLGLSELQTWLFVTVFIILLKDYDASLYDIINYLGMDAIDTIDMKKDIDKMLAKRILITDRSRFGFGRSLRISHNKVTIYEPIMNAIMENITPEEFRKKSRLDNYQFFKEVANLIEKRVIDLITTNELFENLEDMENNNPQLNFIDQLVQIHIGTEERILLYVLSNDLAHNMNGTIIEQTLGRIYDRVKYKIEKINEITKGSSVLIKENLINYDGGGFSNEIKVELTPKSAELLFGDDAGNLLSKTNFQNLKKPEFIHTKSLFFDPKLYNQIERLKNSLDENNYEELQQRLDSLNLTRGIAAMFYGYPGTGKTETALQIAKHTGRNIMVVDISETKSKWYGQSEKIVKQIFRDYRYLCQKSKVKPILLFNEADAVLGTRNNTNSENNSNIDQTENTIQNILLEEIENMDGILIATTNLVGNLDPAFERRFLFKIQFEKPSEQVKQKIWKDKLPWIKDNEAAELSAKYSFSGGEIENIVRKTVINEVIQGEKPTFDELIEYCDIEKLNNKSFPKVGF